MPRTIGVIAVFEHTAWLAGVAMPTGSGLTVTVAVKLAPVHPPALTGVIVYVTVCAVPVTFTGVPLMSPLPLAARPVTLPVLSLVQL